MAKCEAQNKSLRIQMQRTFWKHMACALNVNSRKKYLCFKNRKFWMMNAKYGSCIIWEGKKKRL
jgi:hypothetical protein